MVRVHTSPQLASLAQLVERHFSNVKVVGSSPSRGSMEERKCYYVCCFIEGREKTIEMPPRTGPLTLSEAEDVRKKKSSGRYHRRLRYRILDAEKNKIVGL